MARDVPAPTVTNDHAGMHMGPARDPESDVRIEPCIATAHSKQDTATTNSAQANEKARAPTLKQKPGCAPMNANQPATRTLRAFFRATNQVPEISTSSQAEATKAFLGATTCEAWPQAAIDPQPRPKRVDLVTLSALFSPSCKS